MAVCMAIICIGNKYLEEFKTLFYPSVAAYAQKHGYEVKIFTDFLDKENAYKDAISFQKCLIVSDPSMEKYDRVIVLDADILIEEGSPPIPDVGDKIGIVNEASFLLYETLKQKKFATDPIEYYNLCEFLITTDKILNTGMMICNPKKHGNFLKGIYDTYISKCKGHPRGFHYEQTCIGYVLQTQEMFTCVSTSWNCLFIQYEIANLPLPNERYFVHFAGFSGNLPEGIRRYRLAGQRRQNTLRWGIHK
jgi:hypothetical protein